MGTRYRAVDKFPGRTVEFTVEITEFERHRRMAATWDQPMEGGWESTFAQSDRGTRVDMHAEMNPSGGLMKLLFPLMGGWVRRAMRKDLERFKARLESGAA